MNDVQTVGVLLPDLPLLQKNYSLEGLMKEFMGSGSSSRGAKDFLRSASPSRSRSDGNQKRLILVEGRLLPKDPFTEAVKRFGSKERWTQTSFEDVLRIFPLITSHSFGEGIRTLVFLHNPVKNEVLGITREQDRIVLTSHKAEPREGWFCKNSAFVFRSS